MPIAVPDSKLTPAIHGAVEARYTRLATVCDNLSCGNALEFADLQPGEVLVDLGSGRGRDVIRAASLIGSAGRAIGVDSNGAMLEVARGNAPPGLSNVQFVESDLAAIGLPSESADVVISNCTINHAPDKEAVYREIRRILKPGGRCVVSDVVAEETLPASVRSDPAAWAACYGGAIPEAEYLAAIKAAGLGRPETLKRSAPYDKGGCQVRSLTLRLVKTA